MDLDHRACYRALKTRDVRFDGRLFVAVKTTGIYCRPVCPARIPLSKNVIFYATAAAAQENGFRPCLRCRPETAPDLARWRGTSNSVSRALTLIEMGALDSGGLEQLATRLGLGERQLRRLFQTHLGASPISVASTRRVLLAKQLIHETSLPLTEIAFAAGFSSIRRFNEVFKQLFKRSPRDMRRSVAASAVPRTGDEVRVLLRYKPPYDWDSMISFLKMRAIPGVESVSDGMYFRTVEIAGKRGFVRVRPTAGNALEATVSFPELSALPTMIARLRRVFDLSADPEIIERDLSEDPFLAALIRRHPGLRVPGAWDGFELAMRAVLGQQITLVAAVNLAAKLVVRYGQRLAGPACATVGLTHVFPRPEQLAEADLSVLGMPRSQAKTLAAIASAVTADPDMFGPRRTLKEAIEQLRRVPGIGEWTAQYIAMRALREPDAFPAADIGLSRALTHDNRVKPTPREVLARAEAWRPWRAYAAQHLWVSRVEPRAVRRSSAAKRSS
jgi:AraC family transcriptional regulator of adaptative response / DNA-3-methyladenine glycosylase II